MRNRRLLILLVILAVAAGLVVALFLLPSSQPSLDVDRPSTNVAGPTTQPAPGPGFGTEEASQLQDALTSGDPARLSSVISMAPGDQIDEQFAAQLAAADLRIDAATFNTGEAGTGTVEAQTLLDGVAARWLLVLTSSSGQWQLSTTAQIS